MSKGKRIYSTQTLYSGQRPRKSHLQRLVAREELEKVVAEATVSPGAAHYELNRRIYLMERENFWANKHHCYLSSLDPVGSFCDLCWGASDDWQHLLHPVAITK